MRHENKALIEIKGKKREMEKSNRKRKRRIDMRRRKTMEKPSKEEREERKAMKYNSVWCKWMPTVVKAAHERRDALNANTIADSCCRPRPTGSCVYVFATEVQLRGGEKSFNISTGDGKFSFEDSKATRKRGRRVVSN